MNGNIIIKHASEVVTPSGFKAKKGREMAELTVIRDGAVVMEQGRISMVGRTSELPNHLDSEAFDIIDARGKAVLPGFVDSHTHFVFGGYRAEEFSWRLNGMNYMDIMARGGGIISTVAATRKTSLEELVDSGRKRLDSILSFGVTTVEGKSGYGLDRDTEIRQLAAMAELDRTHPVDIVRTFLGAHAVPAEFKGRTEAYLNFIQETVLAEVTKKGLAEFCDVFCEKDVFSVDQSRRLLLSARELGLKLKLHADEIKPLGGTELAAELGAVSADHLLQASDRGIRNLADSGVIATLLPLTAFSLREPYARGRTMIDHNCAVALATDLNPGSCFSESIPLLFALATLYMGITVEETVTALTLNGAAAIDRANTIGSLDIGKKGDAVILEFPSYRFIPYHIGVNTVEKVIKNGRLVFDRSKGSPLKMVR
jgi:imidazolonepropionase